MKNRLMSAFIVAAWVAWAMPSAHAASEIACMDANNQPQTVSPTNPCPTATTAGSLTIVALDVATVTTGGTAVSASTAGHHNKGGWIQNPPNATINLCINEQAVASGTTSAGGLVCIVPGGTFNFTPNATSVVSVVSSDNAHPFAGEGYK